MMRTHVILSEDILVAIDRVVGQRGRSRFFEEAAREKLDRLALAEAIEQSFAAATGAAYDHWKDRRTAAAWVRKSRRSGQEG